MPSRNATVVVVGNGPSLKADDLEQVIGLPSIGCQRVNLIFPKTNWRPDTIIILETDHMDDLIGDLEDYEHSNVKIWLKNNVAGAISHHYPWYEKPETFTLFSGCGHVYMEEGESALPYIPERWHPGFICSYSTGGFAALQLAYMQGHRKMALIGFDGYYEQEQPNFDEHYLTRTYRDEEITKLNQWNQTVSAFYKRELVDRLGCEIVNCTPGTHLRDFEQQSLQVFLGEL